MIRHACDFSYARGVNRLFVNFLGGAVVFIACSHLACSHKDSSSDDASGSTTGTTGTGGATSSVTNTTGEPQGGSGGSGVGGSGGSGAGGSGGGTEFVAPTLLSETGLYESDMTTLAEGVMPFEPQFILWSDGATKRRWIKLPPGKQIDTSDMDYWVYPVGTKLFKEFTRDGVRVETRLLQKISEFDWFKVAFQWNEKQTDAEARPNGVFDASGTEHDIPSENQCVNCHDKMADISLGFTAVQLSHESDGVTLQKLIDQKLLTDPPAAPFVLPGNETEQKALGYLHVNCGNCHQPKSFVSNTVDMQFWLPTGSLDSVDETPTLLTTVGRRASQVYFEGGAGGEGGQASFDTRIVAGDPDNSIVYLRMTTRETGQGMPPVGTELVDETGSATIRQWISELPTD